MTQDLIYTTTYKAFHLKTESLSIQISDDVWIETSEDFVGQPEVNPRLSYFPGTPSDPQFGLSKFEDALIKSPIRLRVTNSEEDEEKYPFDRDECAYIATALSIVSDDWFVVGIESFSNSREPQNPSFGPFCTFFKGENSDGGSTIRKADEPLVIKGYNFVYQSLSEASWDSDNAKLVFLFLKCVTHASTQDVHVLKVGLSHLFTEWHSTVLFASLFFENVFSEESRNMLGGVDLWNKIFGQIYNIDREFVDAVMNYRHLVAHNNATDALSRLSKWKQLSGYDDRAAHDAVQKFIPKTAKVIMRAIITEGTKFSDYLKQRQTIK